MTRPVFIDEDFLLENAPARELYHDIARDLPIIDYHCHLPPDQIATDHVFENLTAIWLAGDHYKWRAMRTNGVDERFCTGDASDREKFQRWAETVPALLRNPLYHWMHLELRRPFGIDDRLLNADSAQGIWDECNAKLATPDFSTRGIIRHFDVRLICTTDDPIDTLEHHQAMADDPACDVKVVPAWRPDKVMAVADVKAWNGYIDRLAAAADTEITTYSDLLDALRKRHEFFHSLGCRLSDHGLNVVDAAPYTEAEIRADFEQARGGQSLSAEQQGRLRSAMLYDLAVMDAKAGWTQQFHLGAMRNCNTRMFRQLGPDTGFDSIGDWAQAEPLVRLLDRLDQANALAPTILYNLNPNDNEVFGTMLGDFQDGSRPGKMQLGSGWWFNDQLDGMTRQIEALSQLGLLSRFVGMLTDSRSFLSFTRHDYFRRLLCNILGSDIERGRIPNDMGLVKPMVRDICYNNNVNYFGWPLDTVE